MSSPEHDQRSPARRALDDQIAAEPEKASLDLSVDEKPLPVETLLNRLRRPLAVAGVVENGLVRPLDPTVQLAEHSRVIIVTAENN